jgi:hypothetical protein
MFQVFDNDKTADRNGFPRLKNDCWDNSKFETFGEAEAYAIKWLGEWAPDPGTLKVGVYYHYSGYGDMLVIQDLSQINIVAG